MPLSLLETAAAAVAARLIATDAPLADDDSVPAELLALVAAAALDGPLPPALSPTVSALLAHTPALAITSATASRLLPVLHADPPPALTSLSLRGIPDPDLAAALAAQAPTLHELEIDLGPTGVDLLSDEWPAEFPVLHTLRVDGLSQLPGFDRTRFPALADLSVRGFSHPDVEAVLADLSALRITRSARTVAEIKAASPKLHTLALGMAVAEEQPLRQLDLSSVQELLLPGFAGQVIGSLPQHLVRLELCGSHGATVDVAAVWAACPGLVHFAASRVESLDLRRADRPPPDTLEVLDVSHPLSSEGSLDDLLLALPLAGRLRVLAVAGIAGPPVSGPAAQRLLAAAPALETFVADFVSIGRDAVRILVTGLPPSLRVLGISGQSLGGVGVAAALAGRYQRLRKLSLERCKRVGDRFLHGLKGPELVDLNVGGIEGVTDLGMLGAVAGCPRLESVSVYETNISSKTVEALLESGNLLQIDLSRCMRLRKGELLQLLERRGAGLSVAHLADVAMFSPDEVVALAKALPNAYYVTYNRTTSDGPSDQMYWQGRRVTFVHEMVSVRPWHEHL